MRADYIALHHQYRAKSTGMSRAEYAASVQRFERKRRNWPAVIFSTALVVATLWMVWGIA
jgi:hypothetical protein